MARRTLRRRPVSTNVARTVTSTILRPGILIPVPVDHVFNIFESSRAGTPVVRALDLLALRIELRNLTIEPGDPPLLKRTRRGSGYLILHFPPQSITEQAFYQAAPPGFADANALSASETPDAPPIRARIADESRLVFRVPAGTVIPWTLEGVLDAVQELSMKVSSAAKPRQLRFRPLLELGQLFDMAAIARMTPAQRANLSGFAARSLVLGADEATLRLRQISAGTGLVASATLPPRFTITPTRIIRRPTRPSNPNATTTSIEMPWRLIVSPHAGAHWRHATTPRTSPAGTTELWHSRLVTPKSNGAVIEPPRPDKNRTIRAVWAKTGEGSASTMKPNHNSMDIVPDTEPPTAPFRTAMSDFARLQIAHLSSNWSITGYRPEPIDTNQMMLSSLGGWLDSRGAWEVPQGLSVEEWVHRASMARDHYVRVVYKGGAFPFGHRMALIEVTERKFHNGVGGTNSDLLAPQNRAYLRKQFFIAARERERVYDNAALRDGDTSLALQFPFSRVELLTDLTPPLDPPGASEAQPGRGQTMFWPVVAGEPFRFQWAATDLDGRRIAFDLPIIFMDNTVAAPGNPDDDPIHYITAAQNAASAAQAYAAQPARNTAELRLQQVALATSKKSGDTSVQVERMHFGGFAKPGNAPLEAASDKLLQPIWTPIVTSVDARIGAVSHLTGSNDASKLTWNDTYLKVGLAQKGEVFVDIDQGANPARMDFSAQGDRSGGFMQPNMIPKALSRIGGPITSDVSQYIAGTVPKAAGFPETDTIGALPLPLIFGCIPLGAIIDLVSNLDDNQEKIPKFQQESGNEIENFVNTLIRAYGIIANIASGPAGIANAAMDVFRAGLTDAIAQAAALTPAQQADIVADAQTLVSAIDDVATELQSAIGAVLDAGVPAPALPGLPSTIAQAQTALADVRTALNAQIGGQSLPAGFRQQGLTLCQKIEAVLNDIADLPALIAQGQALFDALSAIVGDPAALGSLFEDATVFQAKIDDVTAALGPLKTTINGLDLLDGAARKQIVDALEATEDVLGFVSTIAELFGDELTIRFDWNPEISSWPSGDPIFRVNDKRGFSVAVEAKVKKNGASAPKISVICGLKNFDLVLIGAAGFLELMFEKIEFSIDSKAKTDVDVLFTDIKFVGPLSFVETLRDLIPLDGFSDPPYLDITPQGIDAGFDIALPGITCGVLNIQNISLGAGFTVPFIGQPLSVRFNFCTREQPFLLTVYMFGGGGFFGITIDPSGVQILEASLEFGASLSVDLGVASGGVEVMAGFYFRMEQDDASLTGYFRLGGHVDVLGIISASIELYLELRYEFQSGKCVGKAQLTIEISVFIFSGSVTITCERKFAGSNGDPNLRQMLGFNPELSLGDELAAINANTDYAWRDHCEAFA